VRSNSNGWIFQPVVVTGWGARLINPPARGHGQKATGAYDRGWNTLLSLRSWALVGSSVMAVWTIRHPNLLVRWARRGVGLWSAWRLVKKTLRSPVA